MNRDRIVAGFDVHKDTAYLCIMDQNENILLEKTFTTLEIKVANAYVIKQLMCNPLCPSLFQPYVFLLPFG